MTAAVSVLIVAKRAYGTGRLFTKHGAWYGSWRTPDGRRRTRKIGPVRRGREGLNKTEAEAKLRELIMADNTGEASRAGATPTVKEMGETALGRLKRDGRKCSHVETFQGHLRKHINRPPLGDTPVTDVIEADVEQLVNRMLRAGLAPKTVRNVVGTLHSVMGRAVKDKYIERNPVGLAELPRVPRSRKLRFLSHAELERVLAAAPPDDDEEIANSFPVRAKYGGPQAVRDWWPVVRLLILTAAMTGMRLGELLGLRWSDLDWAAMKVRVREGFVRGRFDDPKSVRGSRGIPLASRLVAELEEHHRSTVWNADNDLVLAHPHTGRPLDRVRLGLHYKAALKRADVRPVRIHDLRHTFGTTVAASGKISLRTLQEWMGHEDIRTTQIYADYMPGEREAELIDEAFTAPAAVVHDRDPSSSGRG
jgi:integrase